MRAQTSARFAVPLLPLPTFKLIVKVADVTGKAVSDESADLSNKTPNDTGIMGGATPEPGNMNLRTLPSARGPNRYMKGT